MHMTAKPVLTAAIPIFMLWGMIGAAQESHVGNLVGNAKRGKALYERYCIFCHGPMGDGRGESAPYLDPKPRDFTKAVFKCRSTPAEACLSTAISTTPSPEGFTLVGCHPGDPCCGRNALTWWRI